MDSSGGHCVRNHVIISGTGRTGTSFLVELLTRLGLDTGFRPETLRLHPLSRAGLEFDIRQGNAPYIVKSPWLSQTLAEALATGDVRIEHAIVPVRDFAAATASRRRIEKLAQRRGEKIPGGLWLTEEPARQREMLERQFARLFELLARHDIPVTLLWFPRLVEDAGYLYRRLRWLLRDIAEADFERVFRETARPEWVHEFAGAPRHTSNGTPPRTPSFRGSPEEEVTRGEVPYREVLAQIHAELAPNLYLEIGVRHGHSLALAQCRAVGVDPEPELREELRPSTTVIPLTSDAFFAGEQPAVLLKDKPDLTFIDGMHHFEYALRDFINAEACMAPHGLIVIDDIYPNHPAQAARERRTGSWTGDVWKLKAILEKYRPELLLLALDTKPSGLLLVAGLDSSNDCLKSNYDAIVAEYSAPDEPPAHVLSRRGAVSPREQTLSQLLARLRQAREAALSTEQVRAQLLALNLSAP
jgi:hypothetical protein